MKPRHTKGKFRVENGEHIFISLSQLEGSVCAETGEENTILVFI